MATTVTDRAQGIVLAEALKSPVRVATTANITLSGLQTIDGVTLSANDRVLVKNQTDATENGIYVVSSSAWSRSTDFNGIYDVVQGTRVYIAAGTSYAGYEATITTDNPITIGTSEINFSFLQLVDETISADLETCADNIADINTCADNIAAIVAAPTEAANAAASAVTAASYAWGEPEPWVTATAYAPPKVLTNAGSAYYVAESHTSGVFADDLTAGKLVLIVSKGADGTGSGDVVGPAGATDSSVAQFDGTTGKLLKNGLSVGTSANNLVQLDGTAKLPAVDGSQLTGIETKVNVQCFTSSGTYTPTTGMAYCIVEVQGAGGGGGGSYSNVYCRGAGGGAGGYIKARYDAATIGSSQSVTIGAAGTAGSASGGDGGTGGTTMFGSLLTAYGGAGGGGCSGGTAPDGGTGGVASAAPTAGFGRTGNSGHCGAYVSISSVFFGHGADSIYGAGGKEQTTLGSSGNAASGYGAGGGGGTGNGYAGSAGRAGIVIITEFIET